MVNGLGRLRHLIARLPNVTHSCLLCENPSHNMALCSGCQADLPWNLHSCQRCALPLAANSPLCAACLQQPPAQTLALAPLRYEFPVDHLMVSLKYQGRLAHAPLLGELLRQHLCRLEHPAPDLIVPVPLHPTRLAERGYNQALEIARPLGRHFKCPLETRLLERSKATVPQMQLDAAERARNPVNAFTLNTKRLLQLQQNQKNGRLQRIALVDDVMTTGATLAAITTLLQHAGIDHVELWLVARTP